MQNVVEILFAKVLEHSPRKSEMSTKTAQECLKDFQDYLIQLKTEHVKKDYLAQPGYLVGWLYSRKIGSKMTMKLLHIVGHTFV